MILSNRWRQISETQGGLKCKAGVKSEPSLYFDDCCPDPRWGLLFLSQLYRRAWPHLWRSIHPYALSDGNFWTHPRNDFHPVICLFGRHNWSACCNRKFYTVDIYKTKCYLVKHMSREAGAGTGQWRPHTLTINTKLKLYWNVLI